MWSIPRAFVLASVINVSLGDTGRQITNINSSGESHSQVLPSTVNGGGFKHATKSERDGKRPRVLQGTEDEYPIELVPFQVFLQYDDNDAMSNRDEMMLLSTTQTYLSSLLEEDQTVFSRLVLYQFVRDYQEYASHYAKVAFGGTAFFVVDHAMEQEIMINKMWLGLLGDNSTKYVKALQEAGMSHIIDAQLMSIQGNEMEIEDGEISEIVDDDYHESNDDESNRMMTDEMRMMTLMLSLVVPGSAICLACLIFVVRSAREIKWTKPDADPSAPEWQTHQHLRDYQRDEWIEEEKVEDGFEY